MSEYAGISVTNPVDVTASASGSSATLNSGTVTTTSANDLIYGAGVSDNAVTAAGTGFTPRDLSYGNITEDRIAGTVGSYSATATHNGSMWGMQLVAFRNGADTTPPVRSNGAPTGSLQTGTTQTPISLTTDENATCRYSTTAGLAYSAMTNTFTTTGALAHSTTVTGLVNGGSYNYYVRCQDTAGNPDTTDFPIAFTVSGNTTPPVRSNGAPTGALPVGTTQTSISLTTDENATCRYSTTAGVAYSAMTNTFSTTGALAHSTTVTGLVNGGSYNYYVRCQDTAGNPDTADFPITFTVSADTTPPVRSNGAPTGALPTGTTQTPISLTTDENATCRYATTAGVAYSAMTSTFTTTGALAHSTTVIGLVNGGSYNYYVRCQDTAGNPDTTDFPITFTVSADTTPPVRSNGAPTGALPTGTTQTPISLTTDENATCRYAITSGVAYSAMTNTFSTTGALAHSTTVTGLINGGSYNYYVRCQDTAGNPDTTDFPIAFTVSADTTPPVRSNGAPTGALPVGTTQTSISLTTDENATCRYSTTAGVAYSAMTNTFSTTGALTHSTTVTGLVNGGSYNYYVRCQDTAGNPDTTDFPIAFTVSADTTPPVRSNGAPTGALPVGTTQTSISLTTDENATCRYAITAGVAYSAMTNTFSTTGALAHSTTVIGLVNGGSYNYYVRCQDTAGNPDTTDFPITFTVSADTTPPVRSNGAPTGALPVGTTQTSISLSTDENATCRYSTTAGVAYSAMTNTFTTTGALAHSTTVTGLVNGGSYNYYVRCQDTAGNPDTTDFAITFTVSADTTPPVRSNGAPSGALPVGTTQTSISLSTDENATCRYSTTAGVAYSAMTNTFTTTGALAHSTTVTGLVNGGSYNYYVRCQDTAGNPDTTDFAIAFTVSADTTPPVRSNGAPSGALPVGTTQTSISLSTDENATCRYATTAGVAYSAMTNTFTTTGALAHSTTVTGLVNGGSYNYYVRCQDTAGNPDTTDFAIAFTVSADTTPPVRSNGAPYRSPPRRHDANHPQPDHE